MRKQVKNSLFLSTALTALIVVSAPSVKAADLSLPGNALFASNGNADSTSVINAAAGDNVDLNNFDLGITIIGTTNDGTANGTLDVGNLTGGGTVTVDTGGLGSPATDNVLAVINSVDGVGTFTVTTVDADNALVNVNVLEGFSVTSDLLVQNLETDSTETVTMVIGGDTTIVGALNISAGDGGAATTVTLNGAANNITGGTVITGGNGASDEAVLVLTGASTNFGGNLTLTNGISGLALLEVGGAVGQTVSGNISGTGDVSVANTSADGASFTGDINIAAITVDSDTADQRAVFSGNVTTSGAIALGGNTGTDSITAIFGSSTGTTTISATGGITDGGSEDTSLVFTGGQTVSVNANMAADQILVTGNTTLDNNQTLNTNSGVTIESGSTVDIGNGAVVSAFTNAGDLNISGSGNVTGAIANTGTLLFDAASTGVVIGNVTGTGTITSDSAAGEVQGTVTQATAEISGALTVTGDYNVTNTYFDASGASLNIGMNADVTGDLNAMTAGDGNLVIEDAAGATTLTGNIGTSNAALNTVVIGGNTGTTDLTVTGNYYVGTTNIGAGDDLNLQSSSQTVMGTIQGVGNNEGRLVIGDAASASAVTFTGSLGTAGNLLNEVLINDLAELTVAGGGTGDMTTLTVDGTLNVGQDKTLNVGTLAGTSGTIDLTVGTDGASSNNSARIVSGAQLAADTTNETINGLTTTLSAGTGTINDGDSFLIYESTGAVTGVADADADTIAATDSSALYDFVIVRGDNSNVGGANDDLYALVSRNSTSSVTSDGNGQSTLNAVLSVAAPTDELATVIASVNNASTDEIDDVLSTLGATTDGGNVTGAIAVSNEAAAQVDIQLAALRSGEARGVTTGEYDNGLRAWGQVFGQTGEQDRRDNVAGYDLDTYGFTAGIDSQSVMEDTVLGVAFTYANTDVDSDNANNTQTDIDTYQLTAYGNTMLDQATYVAGQVSYGFGQNETTRSDIGGAGGPTANGEFDSHQFNVRAEVGRAVPVSESVTLTPKVSLSYLHYQADDYRETGAGNAGLNVESENLNVLELGVGADLGWEYDLYNGAILRPTVSAGVRYDALGEKTQATNQFIGGGAAFKTEGFDPAKTTVDLGFSLKYTSNNDWDIIADYDYEAKEDFDAHAASLKAVYNF